MKRILCLLICFLLGSGCAESAEEIAEPEISGKEENMNITIDTKYGGFMLRFNMPENAQNAQVSAYKADHTPLETASETTVNYDACNLYDLTAYAAYANDYYGDMCFHVIAKDASGTELDEGWSESFHVTDYYPQEQTRSVSGRSPHIFSYTSESSMMMKSGTDMIDACSVLFDEEGASFSAAWFDFRSKRREIEKQLSEKQAAQLKELIESGELVRIIPSDPDLIVLDGTTPARYECTFIDSDRAESRWYHFVPEKSRQEELMAFLKSLCH